MGGRGRPLLRLQIEPHAQLAAATNPRISALMLEPLLERVWAWISDWRRAAFVLRSPIVRIVALIPALAYTVLYSDSLIGMLENEAALGRDLFLDATLRVHLLFLGALTILASLAVFVLCCPRSVRRFSEAEDYVDECIRLQRVSTLSGAVRDVLSARPGLSRDAAVMACSRISRKFGEVAFGNPSDLKSEVQSVTGGTQYTIPASRITVVVQLFFKHASNIYSVPDVRSDLVSIFESQFEVLATEKSVLAKYLCIVSCYVGVALFFLPTAETLARILALPFD